MKSPLVRILLALTVLLAATLACGGSFSTANISNAYTTADPNGGSPTTVFAPEQTFYLVVELANAPDDTVVKAVWYGVGDTGTTPDYVIDEVEAIGSDNLTFNLATDVLWPTGPYKVEIYLNGELDRTIQFEVR